MRILGSKGFKIFLKIGVLFLERLNQFISLGYETVHYIHALKIFINFIDKNNLSVIEMFS